MNVVGFDTETHKIKPGMVAPRMVCLSTHVDSGHLFSREGGLYAFEDMLRKDLVLAAHNFSYDAVVCAAEDPRLLRLIMDAVDDGRMRCTLMRQMLLDIAAGESDFRRLNGGRIIKSGRALDDLGMLYFGESWAKGAETHRLRYGELDGVPVEDWPREARNYPLADAERARRVFAAQEARARELRAQPEMEGVWESEPGEIPDELRQTRKALWLQLMSAWGLRTDPVAVAELRAGHETEQARVRTALEPTGLVRPDGTRDMKLIKTRVVVAYAKLGREVQTTKGGDVSTSGEVLIDSGDPDLMLLGESLSDAATIGTWLPHLEQGTRLPICVGYNPLVDSGRTSARKPNIQNPPRKGKIRSCFVPRAGYVYSFCDYDTAELRALAQVCIWLLGWSDLGDALRGGEDPHLSLAADMEGITYEEAITRSKAGDKVIKDTRQLCKVANFGYPGGLGAEKFILYAHGYDPRFREIVDLRMSKQLRSAWFKKWREMKPYFDCVSEAVGRHGEGAIQQFWSKRVRGGVGFTQVANGTFQGLVADGANIAGWALARECYLGDWMYPPQNEFEMGMKDDGLPSPLLGSRPVVFMHDEFGLEVPYVDPAAASDACDRQQYVQRLAMQEVIPDVPIRCGAVMTRRWYKGSERVIQDGITVPSRPVEIDGNVKWVADV